jgi:hypothetical protein
MLSGNKDTEMPNNLKRNNFKKENCMENNFNEAPSLTRSKHLSRVEAEVF